MLIRTMKETEINEFLGQASLGRIACEFEGQPYISDAYFAAERGFLYSFSTVGQKIRWMRANPRVCVQFEEIRSPQEWATVIVQGVYEELTKTPEHEMQRTRAYTLLQKRAMWWEPAAARSDHVEGAVEPVYFRIRMGCTTGRCGVLEEHQVTRENWLRRIFHEHRPERSAP